MRYWVLVAMLAILGMSYQQNEKPRPQEKARLWAAITINEPVFEEEMVKDNLMLHFSVVNDGRETVNPEIEKSKLFVNGKQPVNWENTIGQGPRDDRFEALASGDYLHFGYAMGENFTKPGIYKVKWKGKNFEAPEITFRVIPNKKN